MTKYKTWDERYEGKIVLMGQRCSVRSACAFYSIRLCSILNGLTWSDLVWFAVFPS